MKKTINVPSNIEGDIFEFDREVYEQSGVFIIRDFIDKDKIKKLQEIWKNFYDELINNGGRKVDDANFVNFKDELPPEMLNFWKSNYVKKLSNLIYGENVALYHSRVLIKDKKSENKVFLHQDYCYHLGFPTKSNLFIPLFDYNQNHGLLSFYPGTHQYGFLGDAGEIDKSKFHPWEKISPSVNAGDVVIMNSCLWHESGPNNEDTDRVMFDIIIQPSDDPSGTQLICGEWETDFWIGRKEDHTFQIDSLFVNSRIKKIKNYGNNK
jgi:hypothetical protein